MSIILTSTGFDPHEGWLGNKFFKYSTLISLQGEFGGEIHLDPWMGDAIFDLSRVKITHDDVNYRVSEGRDPTTLNTYHENYSIIINTLRQNDIDNMSLDIAFNSNTFYHTSYYAKHKRNILDQFSFKEKISEFYNREITSFKKHSNVDKMIVCNMRLGDDYQKKWKFPDRKFCDFLSSYKNDSHTIVVCTDNREKADEILKGFDFLYFDLSNNIDMGKLFEEANLDISLPEYGGSFDFLNDFYLMTKADTLICSDSTFAYSAAMLNDVVNCEFFKYNIGNGKFNRFDPWNTWLMDMRTNKFNDLNSETI